MARCWPADRARALIVLVSGHEEVAGVGLGQSVAVPERDVRPEPAQRVAKRRRQRLAAAMHDAVEGRRFGLGRELQQRSRHRWHDRGPRDRILRDGLERRIGMKTLVQVHRSAPHQGEQRHPLSVAEGELQHQENLLLLAEARYLIDQLELRRVAIVGQYHAFRRAGRAGGEHDKGRAVEQWAMRRRRLVEPSDRSRAAQRGRHSQIRARVDHETRAGAFDEPTRGRIHRGTVDRDRHGTGAPHAEQARQVARAVRNRDEDRLVVPHTLRPEGRGR